MLREGWLLLSCPLSDMDINGWQLEMCDCLPGGLWPGRHPFVTESLGSGTRELAVSTR